MLESLYLTKSQVRQSILALFFTNPAKRYYLRELERMLGYSAGSIRRELLKFQQDNLFITQQMGNLLYYSVNTKHPLFKELKSIVAKTAGVEGSLKKLLQSIKGVQIAFIYGSFAQSKEKNGSDIDLMIIGSPDTSQLNEQIARLERKLEREINYTVYSPEEYMEKQTTESGFVLEVLRKPKIMLIGCEDDLQGN
jgi:predicted nucleotidyltransferase